MPFADKAKALMEQGKITQAKLAEITGISASTISRYLSGEISPKESVAEQILAALGATPENQKSVLGDEGVKAALSLVRDTYEGRIADLKNDLIMEKREKWIFVFLLGVVIACVFALLFIDVTNGSFGWFRY